MVGKAPQPDEQQPVNASISKGSRAFLKNEGLMLRGDGPLLTFALFRWP